MIPFTVVLGVDSRHLKQLSWTWPTWVKHKPDVVSAPLVIFYDASQVTYSDILQVVGMKSNVTCYPWPRTGAEYQGGADKWDDPQRCKMLAGFVHTASFAVDTPYWLKIDTDCVATGRSNWIDPEWFCGNPVVIAPPWGFTKPPDQMLKLDAWVAGNSGPLSELVNKPPLSIWPEPGSDRVCHRRFISRVSFFRTDFTAKCADFAANTCPVGHLPVPSQDGYMFYVATRLGLLQVYPKIMKLGWQAWNGDQNVKLHAQEVL